MKIVVHKFGKPAISVCSGLVEMYQQRLHKYVASESRVVKLNEKTAQRAPTLLVESLKNQSEKHIIICLDEKGVMYDTKSFAQKVKTWIENPGIHSVHFVIGGPYGIEESAREKADLIMSMSKLTLQGDLAWVVIWEQLYRAVSFLAGHPYHHD